MLQAGTLNFQDQRRTLQVAIFPIEMVAGSGIANEGAINSGWRGENFACRKIRPVARTDEATGLNPIKPAVEVSREFGASFGFYGQRLCAQHALAELIAETVDHAIVRAHSLLH